MATIRIKDDRWLMDTYDTRQHEKFIMADNMADQMKLAFFMENFDKILLSELESLMLPKEIQKELLMEDESWTSVSDYEDDELADETESRGYVVLKASNIIEEMELEQLKEKYSSWRNA